MERNMVWLAENSCPPAVGKFAPLRGDDRHYLAHVNVGLECLAADEIAQELDASAVTILQGRVAFCTDAPFASMHRLRSVESVGLLCWASPPPSMPADAQAFGDAYRSFLERDVLPQAAVLGRAWRQAIQFDAGAPISFRVTARRGGVESECVTRNDLARWLAEAWHDASDGGFTATARDYELEILLQWTPAQVHHKYL